MTAPIARRTFLGLAAASLAACRPRAEETASSEESKKAASAFIAKTATEPGIQKLPSGVLYKVIHSGPPEGLRPQLTDEVKVHYEGKLPNGKVFDSSYDRGVPASMPLGRLVPAWQEALQKMRPGDEWILYVPPEQGYGAEGAGDGEIPPNSALIFRIELLGVLPGPGRIQQG